MMQVCAKFCKHAKAINALVDCIESHTYNLSEISTGIKMGVGDPTGHRFAKKSEVKHTHRLLGTQHNRLLLVICAKPDLVDMFQSEGRQLSYILASQ